MSDANQLRLIAADLIHKLWMAGETTQLELLQMQAARSLESPFVDPSNKRPKESI